MMIKNRLKYIIKDKKGSNLLFRVIQSLLLWKEYYQKI
jgi:hypothetical protein